jgi:N-acetylglutamate synthase-like GNAT family acetyltransferase
MDNSDDAASKPNAMEDKSPGGQNFAVRPAKPADFGQIVDLLQNLELDYPGRDLACFFVGESGGTIVAVAELKDLGELCLLSCVGVAEQLQGTGLGRILVNHVLRDIHKDVYLYTLVPGFFRKAGFENALSLPASLPPRLIYGCAACDPTFCLCLVRKANGPRVPIT